MWMDCLAGGGQGGPPRKASSAECTLRINAAPSFCPPTTGLLCVTSVGPTFVTGTMRHHSPIEEQTQLSGLQPRGGGVKVKLTNERQVPAIKEMKENF